MAGAAALARLSTAYFSAIGGSTPVKAIPYERFDNGVHGTLINTGRRVNWGTLSMPVAKVRRNTTSILPKLSLIPNYYEWEDLLQWCSGGTPGVVTEGGNTTTTFGLANVANERTITHNDGYLSLDLLRCAVDKYTIRAQQQQELTLDLEIVGTSYTTPSAFNMATLASTIFRSVGPTYIHCDLTVTIAGTSTYKVASVEVSTDRDIAKNRFFNSTTMPDVIQQDRVTMIKMSLPWGLHYALWGQGAADGSLALTLTFAFTVSGQSFSLSGSFPAVKAETDPLTYETGEETYLDWTAMALSPANGSPPPLLTDEVTWTTVRPTAAT